jgi:hypothetical protein
MTKGLKLIEAPPLMIWKKETVSENYKDIFL